MWTTPGDRAHSCQTALLSPVRSDFWDEDNFRFPILIIDDDPQIRMLLYRFLDPEKFPIQGAADAEEAVSLVARFSPKFILLDLHLTCAADADGLDVLRALRKDGFRNPIYIFSADASFEKANLAVKHGADGYLVKNTTSAFWKRLNAILNYYCRGEHELGFPYANLSLPAAAYLETVGLSERDLQLLDEFTGEFGREKEISRILNRSHMSIRKEFQRIRDRLNARSQAELAKMMGVLGCFRE